MEQVEGMSASNPPAVPISCLPPHTWAPHWWPLYCLTRLKDTHFSKYLFHPLKMEKSKPSSKSRRKYTRHNFPPFAWPLAYPALWVTRVGDESSEGPGGSEDAEKLGDIVRSPLQTLLRPHNPVLMPLL